MDQPTPETTFVEKESYEAGFSDHFKKEILPFLNETETLRLQQYSKLKKRMLLAVPAAPVLLFLGIMLESSSNGSDAFFIKVSIFLIVIVFGWAYAPALQYSQAVKERLMPSVCRFFGGMTYQISGETDVEQRYNGQIFPSFNQRTSEDFIQGEYHGVGLTMHESTLKQRQNKDNYRTVFQGLVIDLTFPKAFSGKTLVLKDGGRLGNFFTGKDFAGLAQVALEDPEFEKQFQVFSFDQVEARFLLTTAFMERLLNLSRLRHGRGVQCVFETSHLVIAIPSDSNLFEPKGIRYSALDVEDLHVFLSQMHGIFELIDVLKLKK